MATALLCLAKMGAGTESRHKLRRLWLSVGWLLVALVTFFSLTPEPPTIIRVTASDKVAHLVAYGVLMLWFLQLYPVSRRPVIAILLAAMGILIEVLQGFTTGRSTEYMDIAANTGGVMLGWMLGKSPLSKVLEALDRKIMSLYG